MPKRNSFKRLRGLALRLYGRTAERVRKFTRQTDEVLTEEPIDFSAPSIPYYENLANRLGLVRVILYMALLVFVVVTVVCNHRLITYENLYYLAKDIGSATLTAQSQADRISYPISSGGADFSLYRGGVVIAGCEVVTAASGSGRQTLSENVAYADPCVRASDKYYLTFGRGETSFNVYNSFVRVYREITEFPIYEAAVGDNGSFAVVTRSRDYTSEVVIYDGDMEKLANYHLNGYVTGISMNGKGDCLGIVSVESVDGIWETKVTLIRVARKISAETVTLTGSLGSSCGFITEDRFAVVCRDRLMILDTDATVKGEAIFEGTTPVLCAVGDGRVALLFKADTDMSEYRLDVLDRAAKVVYSVSSEGALPAQALSDAAELALGGDILYIRTTDTLYRLSNDGRTVTCASISRDTSTILATEDEVLVCTPAYAARLTAEDFAAP